MRFDIQNPAFLQAAGSAQSNEYVSFVDASGSPKIRRLSATGNVRIVSTYNGVQTTQLLVSPNGETVNVQSDPNTQVFLYGKITLLFCNPDGSTFTDFTTLDVTKAISLTTLNCGNNQLTSLDVSANTALTSLNCGNNQLTSLDVSANTALTTLSCHKNQLTSLDVSANTALTILSCENNQLTSLDVSANTALTSLYCHNNQLTSLDVSANTALTSLYCHENQLTSLDVSANTALTYLQCTDNQLTSLDVSANTALTTLYCGNNYDITSIQSVAVNGDVASGIATLIDNADSTTGTVTLRNGDEFNSTISDAATAKGWTVEYVDA